MKAYSYTYDEWKKEFNPEPVGDNFSALAGIPAGRIWTEVSDGEVREILSGWHFVNQIGYWISEKPIENLDDMYYVFAGKIDWGDDEQEESEE